MELLPRLRDCAAGATPPAAAVKALPTPGKGWLHHAATTLALWFARGCVPRYRRPTGRKRDRDRSRLGQGLGRIAGGAAAAAPNASSRGLMMSSRRSRARGGPGGTGSIRSDLAAQQLAEIRSSWSGFGATIASAVQHRGEAGGSMAMRASTTDLRVTATVSAERGDAKSPVYTIECRPATGETYAVYRQFDDVCLPACLAAGLLACVQLSWPLLCVAILTPALLCVAQFRLLREDILATYTTERPAKGDKEWKRAEELFPYR